MPFYRAGSFVPFNAYDVKFFLIVFYINGVFFAIFPSTQLLSAVWQGLFSPLR